MINCFGFRRSIISLTAPDRLSLSVQHIQPLGISITFKLLLWEIRAPSIPSSPNSLIKITVSAVCWRMRLFSKVVFPAPKNPQISCIFIRLIRFFLAAIFDLSDFYGYVLPFHFYLPNSMDTSRGSAMLMATSAAFKTAEGIGQEEWQRAIQEKLQIPGATLRTIACAFLS